MTDNTKAKQALNTLKIDPINRDPIKRTPLYLKMKLNWIAHKNNTHYSRKFIAI
jgi:hypothetical protein